jgi:hypothetical protein
MRTPPAGTVTSRGVWRRIELWRDVTREDLDDGLYNHARKWGSEVDSMNETKVSIISAAVGILPPFCFHRHIISSFSPLILDSPLVVSHLSTPRGFCPPWIDPTIATPAII